MTWLHVSVVCSTRGLIDKTAPASSTLIAKATGGLHHGGGTVIAPGGPEATLLTDWVAGGAPENSGGVPLPDMVLVNPTARNLVDSNAEQQMIVLAWYRSTGAVADITRVASYTLSGTASIDSLGLLKGTGPVTLTASYAGVPATADFSFDAAAALAAGDSPSPIRVPLANTGAPTIAIAGGNNQTGAPGALLPVPLSIVVTGATGPLANMPVTFSVGGGGTLSNASTATDAQGRAQAMLTLGRAPGPNRVDATVSGVTVTFTETGRTPFIAIVSGDGQVALTGATLAPFVSRAIDATGAPLAGATMSFAITSPGGGALSAATAATDANGAASTTLTLPSTPGTTTVEASIPNGTPATFSATAEAPVLATVSGTPQAGAVGTTLRPFVVSLKGPSGAVPSATIRFAIAGGSGTLSGAPAPTDARGLASTTLTLPSTPGTTTVQATYPGATGSPQVFTATATVGSPGSVAVFAGNNQTGVTNAALQPFVVLVTDAKGNSLANVAVSFAIASGSGTLSTPAATTAANGQASAVLTQTGAVGATTTVAATVPGVQTPAIFTATVSATPVPTLAIVSGDGQTGVVKTALGTPLVVRLDDASGKAQPNATVTFTATNGTVAASAVTDANGKATVTFTLGPTIGPASVTASYPSASDAVFSERAIGPPTVAILSGDGQSGAPNAALAAPLVIAVKDGPGAPLANASVTFAVTAGGGTLSGATPVTNASGQAQVSLTLGPAAGTNTVSATCAGSTVTFTETATAAPSFDVSVWPIVRSTSFCAGCHDAAHSGNFLIPSTTAAGEQTVYGELTTKTISAGSAGGAGTKLVNVADPTASGMVQKMTGGLNHGGGVVVRPGSTEYNTIVSWIQGGAAP